MAAVPRSRIGRRGNVLLHVLMTGVIVAFISAMVLRMALLRYTVTGRAHQAAQNLRSDQGQLSLTLASWGGNVCSGTPAGCGTGCAVNKCGCSCICGAQTLTVSCPAPVAAWPACGQCKATIDSGNPGNAPF